MTTLHPRALVTGAGSRIGRAIALALAQEGYQVAVHYNGSQTGAESVVQDIRAAGGTAVSLQANLLDEGETASLVERAASALEGPLTLLVNNASIFEYDNIETATSESWDRHVGSNLRAPFFLTQAFAAQAPEPVSDENGEPLAQAQIVNMIDQRVHKLTPEFMTYTIAKMGLWAFTRTAAQALGGRVRVNGIGPGPTMIGTRQSEEHFRAQRAGTITGRGSDPGEITKALIYLLTAHSVTGQLICADGGQHLGWQTPDILGVVE